MIWEPPKWYIRAVRELEEDLDSGRITQKEFAQAARELDRDLDEEYARRYPHPEGF